MNDPDTVARSDRFSPTAPPKNHRGPDWWLMVRKFFRKGTEIASVAPSSKGMVRTMLKGIDFTNTRTLVELGAGTGPVTAELVQRAAGTNCRLLIVEMDPDFCARLRKKFPGTEIIQGDATDLDRILTERGIDRVDQIVSGLPTPSLPKPAYERLFAAVGRRLDPAGDFRQLTIMPWVFAKFYKKFFADVRFKLVPMNVPPGGVYTCRGVKTKP
jgi:phospholipid N-methyltransferase